MRDDTIPAPTVNQGVLEYAFPIRAQGVCRVPDGVTWGPFSVGDRTQDNTPPKFLPKHRPSAMSS
eukprot:4930701-Pyramimonas_sp.AAC.1